MKPYFKYILIICGSIDLISFVNNYEMAIYMMEDLQSTFNYGFETAMGFYDKAIRVGLPVLHLTMMILLLGSGCLLVMAKKAGIIFSYYLFPFRILFFMFTFGFILKLFMYGGDTIIYRIGIALIVLLEIFRLFITISIHRKYFHNKKFVKMNFQ